MAVVVTGFCAYRLALCAFVYLDASSRGADAMSWLGLASVLGIIGLAVWLITRPRPPAVFLPPYGYPPVPGRYPPAIGVPPAGLAPPAPWPPPAGYPLPGMSPPQWLPPFVPPPPAASAPTVAPAPPFRPFSVHRMLATFLAAMAVTVFVELPLAFLLISQVSGGSTDPAVILSRIMTPGFLLLSVAIQDALLVGLTYVSMFRPGHLSRKDIGAAGEDKLPRGVAVGALAGLALFAVASGLGWLVERTGLFGPGESLFQVGSPSALLLVLIATVAIAPPAEELFFRGYALPVLERKWGPAAGICLSALMFSVVHGSLSQLVPIFLAGVILAMLFRKWGIVPCIAAHAVNNALAVVLLYLGYG